jgi:methyl-accepting chemotaxis protein
MQSNMPERGARGAPPVPHAAERPALEKPPQRLQLPLIGRKPVARQVQILGMVLLVVLAGIATLLTIDRRQSAHVNAYLTTINEMQTLSQRIGSTAQQAAEGMPASFAHLHDARSRFGRALTLLIEGGDHFGRNLPPSPQSAAGALIEMHKRWQVADRDIAFILGHRATLLEPRGGTLPPDPAIARARQAARDVSAAAEHMFEQSREVSVGYRGVVQTQNEVILGALALSALALVCLLLIGRIVVDDAESRAFESQQAAAANERANQRTQEAILRLLDEMGSLAQGDLTVRANIGDEVTGAIADSVNYAVDELRRLVAGINEATTHVATASGQAQSITHELLDAAQRQSREITDTTAAVAGMSASIVQVSARADQSAVVAEESLTAATLGSSAVRRAMLGMDGIREQIQETAKRIKRLGESSQEIGEMVDLISDITEQTNVLALNATIQATSAGSAGRGFTLVAKEVQRLAERSAQATKQISAIVKTIQSDTQDAIAAMERSTEGVVEQAALADDAGRALMRIDQVSRHLAQLIGDISAATREQTESAARIARTMHDILEITELTTEGTRRTADSTAHLAGMAARLKQSVADFKLQ